MARIQKIIGIKSTYATSILDKVLTYEAGHLPGTLEVGVIGNLLDQRKEEFALHGKLLD